MAAPLDFRFLDEGLGGEKNKKRKRIEENERCVMDVDVQQHKRQAIDGGESKPVFGKPTYDGVIAGKVSGRKWKSPKTTRASAVRVSHKGTSLEERNRLKQIATAYKERKKELKEQIRLNKVEKRKRIEEAKKRKEANTLRTGMKLQKVTNPKKLLKMSKSQKKKLIVVPPESVK